MRIQELNLLAYGKFTDHKLSFPSGKHDFHVIVGPNEAGKSTVRRAITELLFGMERQSPLGFKHPQSDLRISAVLDTASGKLTFVRSKQQKSLRSSTDEPLPDSYLAPALGSLTQDAFEQLHCLDHERLVKGGQGIVDPRNTVSQILFQAASGLDTFAVVREALAARAGELFANRGRNNEYTKAADRHAAAQKTLKEVQVRTREWVEARDELKNADEELDKERNSRRDLQLQHSAWERARRLGPLVERLARLQLELEELGDTIAFPPSAKKTLDAGISDMNAAAGIVQTRQNDVKARQQELDAIAVDEKVLERAADIERLSHLCGLYANHPRDLLLRRNEVKQWLVDVLARSAEFGWGATEEDVRRVVPQEKVLRAIDALLKESGALLEGERAANDAFKERQAEAKELQGKLDTSPDARVDPRLSQALSEALPYKNTESKQKNLHAAVTAAEAALKRALGALGRSEITEDSLRSMNLPSLERVAVFRANRQEIAQQAELARSLMEQSKETAAKLELQVSQFERSHKVVTAGEVSGARRERDDKWGAIKSGTLALSDGAPQLDVALRLADELVDARTLSETDGVTLQGLRDQHENAKEAQSRHSKTLDDKELELEEFDARWSEAASQMGLEGMELDDMPDWLAKRDTVLVAAANHAGKKQEWELEQNSAAEARDALAAAMENAGLTVNEASGLSVLCSLAEEHNKGVERAKAQRQSLQQQLRDAESSLRLVQQTRKTKAAALEAWNKRWKEALERAHFGGVGEDVAEVEAAVQAAGIIRQRLEKIDSHRAERIETMESDLEQLKTAAQALLQSLTPELVECSHDELSRVLSAKLEQAKRQSHRKTQAQEFLDDAKRQLAEARSTLEQAKRSLEPLLKAARVEDPMLALPLVEKAEKKVELQASIAQTTNSLEEGSDGLTLEQVKAEVETHPAAEAPGRLTAIKDSLDDSDRRLTQLVQSQLAAKQKFDAINGGDRGAVAEAQKQEALTDISEAGEEYLQLATASSLLKWAVDKYRDRKQGPLLLRAGAVFKELTRGSFEKLRIDYDQSSPALLAYRASGQPVKVSGLSDGTRDQLFLALRIAALELQTEQSAPIPFVADDLFINFDDNRSQAGLQALYELSTKTQVLFLSHHEHLLPVLEKLFGGVNVIALEGEEMLA
jgi:chromosome segregation protein